MSLDLVLNSSNNISINYDDSNINH